MEIIRTVADMHAHADEARRAGRRLALVPTMGALHDGHVALVEEAGRRADHVTVSVFVNPAQFGPNEDFARYPRTLQDDLAALDRVGEVDVVFAPDVEALYPGGVEQNRTWVTVEELDAHLCGAHRPGHFRGVATVVAKLFNACRPHIAVFGRKDAQQLQILRRMVEDLCFDVEVVGLPTVREPDGLALSSRNRYLSPEERAQAGALYAAVEAAEGLIRGGEQRGEAIVEAMRRNLAQAADGRVQYAEVVDAATLQPVERLAPGQEVVAAVAVSFGGTRLIDNVFTRAPEGSSG